MEHVALLLFAILPCLVIAAGLHDLTTMKIPNWISGALIVAFFPTALMVGMAPMTVGVHVGVALAVLVCGMVLFALRWIGGGDAKLMTAVSLWFGLTGTFIFLLWTAVLGGAFCLGLLMARTYVAPYLPTGRGWVGHLMQPKGDIPYGVAIAAGALMAYPASPFLAIAG